jgi:putative ABC transport system substrate-binding protein
MRRREFIAGLGSAVAWPVVARAQQRVLPVIGFIGAGTRESAIGSQAAFLQGLGENGYADGRNVTIEYRWYEGQYDRVQAMVSDLVGRRVAVIAVSGTAAALAAKAATRTIPIVFRIGGNPVGAGLLVSLNKPNENLTGVTTLATELLPKRLQLLRELLPTAASLGYLATPTNANFPMQIKEIEAAAHLLGVNLVTYHVISPRDIDAAFADMAERGIGGLVAGSDPLNYQEHRRLIALSAHHAIPAIYSARFFVEPGGLMSYGIDANDGFRIAGVYTGRILSGEKPADLPVQESTKVELALNLKVAKALGITFPTSLLVRADEVIE